MQKQFKNTGPGFYLLKVELIWQNHSSYYRHFFKYHIELLILLMLSNLSHLYDCENKKIELF